jgi:serine/threonine-protein kinase
VTLPTGERLGSYQVIALLGAGGMGEVYRASDSKLGRVVALKVLPSGFDIDAQRMSRFQREAQILAALNHPNIATIHGLEDSGPVHALVMELVEGPTLADRIAEGPLPLDEALTIAAQIAEALEYAHERGIIHRDLKPANVKITPDGKVKVLDFGLAKALEDAPEPVNIGTSPTLSVAATRAGIILGTAAYMPPEQAKGKSVDRRGDVWSFGVVLYEMLTGKQLYTGETASEVMAAVIMKEPDVNSLPPGTPAPIRQLIRRCLTRDPRLRLRDIGEARIAINDYLANPAAANAETAISAATIAISQQSYLQRALPWTVAALAIAIAAIISWSPWHTTTEPVRPMRLSAEIGAPVSLTPGETPVVVSPDGERYVFTVVHAVHGTQLFARLRDQLEAAPIADTEGGGNPFFSPDSKWIAFFAGGKLKKIPAQGGAAVTICDASSNRGGAFSEDGATIYFAAGNREPLSSVSSAGGTPQRITSFDASKGEITHRWPQALPGGNTLMFLAHSAGEGFEQANVVVQNLKTGDRKTVFQGAMYPRYLPTGHLLFARQGTLYVVPFNLDRLEANGQPVPFVEHVEMNTGRGSADYSFSNSGLFVYQSGSAEGRRTVIKWMNKDGKFQMLRAVPGAYGQPRISPDGNRLAVAVTTNSTNDLWVYDIQRDTMSRITFGPGDSSYPSWSPDGQRIAFTSDRGTPGTATLYSVRADGTGDIEKLVDGTSVQYAGFWSPDSKFLPFFQRFPGTGLDIWILPFTRDANAQWKPGKPFVFLNTSATEAEPAFSPDGRWVAYESSETGVAEVYVRPFPGPGGK